jgi:UDPglucose--hexose-1-phosphate uridylyltransferase
MSELRRDPILGRWNIVDTEHPAGPEAYAVDAQAPGGTTCPFCPGQEAMTPPEVYAVRPNGGAPDGPGWRLRVVPNKFPALRIEGELERRGFGLFDLCNGVGAHEVIIETPDHRREMAELTVEELTEVIRTFQLRSLDLRGDRRLKYTLLFKNVGLSAGASLAHPHSQLIALPIVPKRVREELVGSERYYEFRDRCAYCDMVRQELADRERLVVEHAACVAFCPFMSGYPFEVWILPTVHRADFATATQEEMAAFAQVLQQTLRRLGATFPKLPYNFIIHTSPIESREREAYHWHLELIPKLTRTAGFEWGSGFYINPTSPEFAARLLRAVNLPV